MTEKGSIFCNYVVNTGRVSLSVVLVHRSNGDAGYKFFSFNLTKSTLTSFGGLIDPVRNVGKSWAHNTLCAGATDATVGLAIWQGGYCVFKRTLP